MPWEVDDRLHMAIGYAYMYVSMDRVRVSVGHRSQYVRNLPYIFIADRLMCLGHLRLYLASSEDLSTSLFQ